jgi:plastocyanin
LAWRLLAGGASAGLFMAGCAGSDTGGSVAVAPDADGAGAITVTARELSYEPSRIEVVAGAATTVTFHNEDEVAHTLTVYLASSATGAPVADTGEVPPGGAGEITVLFGSGAHDFRCEIHPDEMSGVIAVR